MATQYPISMDDMTKITGVSKGKATRYGKLFLELIKKYVEENEIDRPTDIVIKQVANKSKVKINIIQAIDRKMPLDEVAKVNGLNMDEMFEELDAIVTAGTKVNIDYYLDDRIDDGVRDDIMDYFMEATSDSIEVAFKALKEDDITIEEIKLMRLKFLSDMGN
jgi:ATP-dependent DNA helicase RecQ